MFEVFRCKKQLNPEQKLYCFEYPDCISVAISINVQITTWTRKDKPETLFTATYFEINNDTHQITFTDELYLLILTNAGIGELWLKET